MSQYLQFHFNIKDPLAKSLTVVVNDSPTNYIAQSFLQIPIYDNFDVQIGYKVSDDYIQQLDENLYSIRINSTYHFLNGGSISWQFVFTNTIPSYYYPLNVNNASNIIATTGEYFGKTGAVSLVAHSDGRRDVTIGFNF
jgi:hypothetical protein